MRALASFGFAVLLLGAASAQAQEVARVEEAAELAPLAVAVGGRVQAEPDGTLLRQWPGTYFETAFSGDAAYFRVGPGEVSLRVRVDGGPAVALVRPAVGTYRVAGLGPGAHRLRVDVASESQAGPTGFGGFFAAPGTAAAPVPGRVRAIEFIGDSHTVGYGNTSTTRECTAEEVWATTDTTLGPAALTAAHYGADYEVNVISGRGIVRNYNGAAADTLPEAYPFVLFDKAVPVPATTWQPQVIAIGLGTNDFSTSLHSGEKWATREELAADYEATYVRFVEDLRARAPGAYIVIWATDIGEGEVLAAARGVVERLRSSGVEQLGFVAVEGLEFSACNHHPSLADDRRIAEAIIAHLDAAEAWEAER